MKRHRKTLVALALVAVVVVLYVTGVLPKLPDPKKAIEDIATTLGPATYAFVAVLAFLETGAFVGLLVPGETVVIVGGVIAGQGEIDLLPLIGLVWASCVLGDSASFFIGRKLGRSFVLKHGARVKIDERRLEKVETFFERRGGMTILIGRFVGLLRALAPFVAGSSGFPYRRFLPFSVIGCGLWVSLFSTLGYVFYRSFDRVTAVAGQATLALGITVAVGAGVYLAYRRLRDPERRARIAAWLDRQGRRPLLRPLRSALVHAAPQVRFLRDRLTPGRLGLELTTALAVAGVGLYVFVLNTVALADGRRLLPGDQWSLDLADKLHNDTVVDVARVVTDLGSFTTVAALVFGVGILLLARRRFTELTALIVGSLVIYASVKLTKAAIDRPRPSGALEDTDGLLLSQRPRGLLHDLGRRGARARPGDPGLRPGHRPGRRRVGHLGGRGPVAHLSAHPLLVGRGGRLGSRRSGPGHLRDRRAHRRVHPQQWRGTGGRAGRVGMSLDLTTTELAIAMAAGIVGAGYIAFILLPAIAAYGRLWEKVTAGLLTLFTLATLLGIGGALGLAIVWSYDRYA